MNLFDDPEFKEWFDSKPKAVQEAILRKPPGEYKYLAEDGEYHSGTYQIIAYEEADDGTCTTARGFTEGAFGLIPREVFRVKLDRLHPITLREES